MELSPSGKLRQGEAGQDTSKPDRLGSCSGLHKGAFAHINPCFVAKETECVSSFLDLPREPYVWLCGPGMLFDALRMPLRTPGK